MSINPDKRYLLAFESSCDDSSIAIADLYERLLIDNITYSQDIHSIFGGIVPELASRDHLKKIPIILDKIMIRNDIHPDQIKYLACTYRPGLIGSLLMGIMACKTLSYSLDIPFVGVNHLYSHIFADFWKNSIQFPFLAMVISGGHSDMFMVKDYTGIERIGMTVDDAAGEILDKIAKEMGLSYPGGPEIEKYAGYCNDKDDLFDLPVPMRSKNNYNLSFSGLKTACYLMIKEQRRNGNISEEFISKLSLSLLNTVSEAIFIKGKKALRESGIKRMVIGGGVMRNNIIKKDLRERFSNEGIDLHIPIPEYCTDNAAMVAYLGMIYSERGLSDNISLNAYPGYE